MGLKKILLYTITITYKLCVMTELIFCVGKKKKKQ